MSNPHGRPPSDEPKTHETKIRMSDNDIAMLEYCCKRTGKRKSQVIRMGVETLFNKLKAEETGESTKEDNKELEAIRQGMNELNKRIDKLYADMENSKKTE